MTTQPARIPWASEAPEEAWLKATGELARDAIKDALETWTVEQVIDAYRIVYPNEFMYIDEDTPATAMFNVLDTCLGFLSGLEIDPEDAIRVCMKMKIPGDWGYSTGWDPRSL